MKIYLNSLSLFTTIMLYLIEIRLSLILSDSGTEITSSSVLNNITISQKQNYYYTISKTSENDLLISISILEGDADVYFKISHPNNATFVYPSASDTISITQKTNLFSYIIIPSSTYSVCKRILDDTSTNTDTENINNTDCVVLITVITDNPTVSDSPDATDKLNIYNLEVHNREKLSSSSKTLNTTTSNSYVFLYTYTSTVSNMRTLTFYINSISESTSGINVYIYNNSTKIPRSTSSHYTLSSYPYFKSISLDENNPYANNKDYTMLVLVNSKNEFKINVESSINTVDSIYNSKESCSYMSNSNDNSAGSGNTFACYYYFSLGSAYVMNNNLKFSDDYLFKFALTKELLYGSIGEVSYSIINVDPNLIKSYKNSIDSSQLSSIDFKNNDFSIIKINAGKMIELNTYSYIGLRVIVNSNTRMLLKMIDISDYNNNSSNGYEYNYLISGLMNDDIKIDNEMLVYNYKGSKITSSFKESTNNVDLRDGYFIKLKRLLTDGIEITDNINTSSEGTTTRLLQDASGDTSSSNDTSDTTDNTESNNATESETSDSTSSDDPNEPTTTITYPELNIKIKFSDDYEYSIANLTDTYYLNLTSFKDHFSDSFDTIAISSTRNSSVFSVLLSKTYEVFKYVENINSQTKNDKPIIMLNHTDNAVMNNEFQLSILNKFPNYQNAESYPYINTFFRVNYNMTYWYLTTSLDISDQNVNCPLNQYISYYKQYNVYNSSESNLVNSYIKDNTNSNDNAVTADNVDPIIYSEININNLTEIYSNTISSQDYQISLSNKELSLNEFTNSDLYYYSYNNERQYLSYNETYYVIVKTQLICSLTSTNYNNVANKISFSLNIKADQTLEQPLDPDQKNYTSIYNNETDSKVFYERINVEKINSDFTGYSTSSIHKTETLELFEIYASSYYHYFEFHSCNGYLMIKFYVKNKNWDGNEQGTEYFEYLVKNNFSDDEVGYFMYGMNNKKYLIVYPQDYNILVKIVKGNEDDKWAIQDSSSDTTNSATDSATDSTTDSITDTTTDSTTDSIATDTATNTTTDSANDSASTGAQRIISFKNINRSLQETETSNSSDSSSKYDKFNYFTPDKYDTSITSSYIVLHKTETTKDLAINQIPYQELSYLSNNKTILISYITEDDSNMSNKTNDYYLFYTEKDNSHYPFNSVCFFLEKESLSKSSLSSLSLSNMNYFYSNNRLNAYYNVKDIPDGEFYSGVFVRTKSGNIISSDSSILVSNLDVFTRKKGFEDTSYFYILFFTVFIALLLFTIYTILLFIKLDKDNFSSIVEHEDEDIFSEITNKINY